jgi:hypothetical protein
MVAGHALVVRPYSELAQDIPEQAYVVEGERWHTRVVTASRPMSLYCMGTLREQLQRQVARYTLIQSLRVSRQQHSARRGSRRPLRNLQTLLSYVEHPSCPHLRCRPNRVSASEAPDQHLGVR